MKATLHKTENGWIAKWSDLQSFTHGIIWEETLLHPMYQNSEFIEGQEVNIELDPLDPENPFHDFRAYIVEPEISIEEGNKIIADFMGIKKQPTFGGERYVYNTFRGQYSVNLYFHESWDWLMPVLIKIENELDVVTSIQIDRHKDVGHKDLLGGTSICLFDGDFQMIVVDSTTKIEALWKAIVKFLIWYNGNK